MDNFVYSVDFLCCFPKSYNGSEFDRLRCYRVLNGLYNKNKTQAFKDDILNRFGVLPDPSVNLINMRFVVLLACRLNITALVCKDGELKLVFNNAFKRTVGLFKFLKDRAGIFEINNHSFEVLKNATGLFFSFNQGTKISSVLILDLLKELYIVCKKV